VSTEPGAVEKIVRSAHEQIVQSLVELDVDTLREGLVWSRSHYSRLDIEKLLETAIALHEDAGH
jgi:hypothetical protein